MLNNSIKKRKNSTPNNHHDPQRNIKGPPTVTNESFRQRNSRQPRAAVAFQIQIQPKYGHKPLCLHNNRQQKTNPNTFLSFYFSSKNRIQHKKKRATKTFVTIVWAKVTNEKRKTFKLNLCFQAQFDTISVDVRNSIPVCITRRMQCIIDYSTDHTNHWWWNKKRTLLIFKWIFCIYFKHTWSKGNSTLLCFYFGV